MENITDFIKAFLKVQTHLQPALKDSLNPHFKSKYADLASCYDACRKILSDNGFVILQYPFVSNDQATMLRSHLIHTSGQSITGELYVCDKSASPQVRGSALTYARRYSLVTMVGLATEDDDGNTASQIKPKTDNTHLRTKSTSIANSPSPKQGGDFVIDFGKPPLKGLTIREAYAKHEDELEKLLKWAIDNSAKPFFQSAVFEYQESMSKPQGEVPMFDEDIPFPGDNDK